MNICVTVHYKITQTYNLISIPAAKAINPALIRPFLTNKYKLQTC